MPKVLKEPCEEIVTLEDVKSFLRITHSEDDGILTSLIKAARKTIEQFTNKVLLPQEQEWSISGDNINFSFHDGLNNSTIILDLPVSPVSEVTSVFVRNGDIETAIKSYHLVDACNKQKLIIDSNLIYQTSFLRISYIAGFKSIENIPDPLKVATIMVVGGLYRENDVSFSEGLSKSVKYLIRPYRNILA